MVILRKIRSATLVETLCASVLIILVFLMASFSFNTLFNTRIQNDQSAIQAYIKKLTYLYSNQKITLPYAETVQGWEIEIQQEKDKTVLYYRKGDQEIQKVLTIIN